MSLYRNIHKRRKSGKKMRKPGQKGAPSARDFKNAAKTVRKKQMSDLYIHEKVRNIIQDRKKLLAAQIVQGQVEDFSAFKELRARIAELANIEQELDALLKKVQYE